MTLTGQTDVGVSLPSGWAAGTAACGIKALTAGASAIPSELRDDLVILYSERPCDAGGVFTTNKVKAAPVIIDQLHLQQNRVQAVVVNSGNANACTGAQGFKDALLMAKLTADNLDLDPPQVLICSTGVIGRPMPMEAVKEGVIAAARRLSSQGGVRAARAIMTTDTQPKTAFVEVELGGVKVGVWGMAKGSGMIHPNLATLLSFITTDAAVERGLCSGLAGPAADRSFNQVTVDGDSSTNDTFLLLANGAAGNEPVKSGTAEAEALLRAIVEVGRQLARAVARDGEGATKLITVKVSGAQGDGDARLAARAVAASSLVKTAIHGGDPNWGRIVCALGYSGAEMALDKLRLEIAGLEIFARGTGQDPQLAEVRKAFEQSEIEINADLGMGTGWAEAWGCDLSEEYVHINADYTT
ncbi:MAG TPA: bifunctional glutamate N-acetyltransferase/amino-acid acetyltransferase ArgJ [Candidatus Dormibacteraeota bacterium]|jgi:glutamate N-acetyltransferase/amino-acid N-acetyltransferase|nr:bifunctional glutamate N-acetyltransferase/amino-acid acetyltransferase ArgJ [Candidatus Dormibacteraeota bacterium]